MLLGTDITAVLATLEALKVDVIGLNCSTGPNDMRDAIRFLGEFSATPIHCIPNAGLPQQGRNGETIFPRAPTRWPALLGEFVEQLRRRASSAVAAARPSTTSRAIAERVSGHKPGARPAPRPPHVSSMIAADAAGPGAGPDDRRRARQLPGLAQGQGDAARPTTTTACCRSPRTRSRAAPTCSTCASR